MPLNDPAQSTAGELTPEPVITEDEAVREYIARLPRSRAADAGAARTKVADLTDAEITDLLTCVTDEAVRDALVKVLWTRAAQQARASG